MGQLSGERVVSEHFRSERLGNAYSSIRYILGAALNYGGPESAYVEILEQNAVGIFYSYGNRALYLVINSSGFQSHLFVCPSCSEAHVEV
jgi:hypothetical protein